MAISMNSTGNKHRIMLVDDEETVLNALRRTFRGSNYEVETYTVPAEALKRARHWDFDVIVSDYRMPGMDGVELVREIKAHRPGLFAVMLCGFSHLGAVLGAINEAEEFRYVTKPWNDDEIRSLVATAITRKHQADKGQGPTTGTGEKKAELSLRRSAMEKLEAKYPGITSGIWTPGDAWKRRP
jgi:two-component system probable response regulator PhcQ